MVKNDSTFDPILERFKDLSNPGARRRSAVAPPPEETEYDGGVEMWVGDKLVTFYRIGTLAHALNRKPVTIRSWEDSQRLPMSRYRTRPSDRMPLKDKANKGRRLYTKQQIDIVVSAAKRTGVYEGSSPDWATFTALVIQGWTTA